MTKLTDLFRPAFPRAAAVVMATVALSACVPAPAPAPEPIPAAMPVAPVVQVSGLQSREPDLCKAKDYTASLGQPSSVISTLGITRKFRVVEYRGIEPQEYDPTRIVFRLDAANRIQNIDCG